MVFLFPRFLFRPIVVSFSAARRGEAICSRFGSGFICNVSSRAINSRLIDHSFPPVIGFLTVIFRFCSKLARRMFVDTTRSRSENRWSLGSSRSSIIYEHWTSNYRAYRAPCWNTCPCCCNNLTCTCILRFFRTTYNSMNTVTNEIHCFALIS